MRILIIHNHYGDFAFGGEAMVMKAEAELLREHGHEVFVYERTNAEIAKRNMGGKIMAFMDMTWSPEGYRAVANVIDEFKPDIMHVHNYKFLLSPSIFKAAKDRGVATVHTLHNYRLCCPGGQLMCNQKVCEDCLSDKRYYRILWRRCRNRKSYHKNILELYLFYGNKKRHYLAKWIDAYVCLSNFARNKYIEIGIPEDKLYVKPNFMADPLDGSQIPLGGNGAIFVGRLSPEKGVATLLKTWQDIDYPLTIVGDGPLEDELKKSASDKVKFVGFKTHQEVMDLIKESAFMVFPSELYEGFPLSLLEAMATGKPVIASDLGPRREVVIDGVTGLLFKSGNVEELKNKIKYVMENPYLLLEMGQNARKLYLKLYTSERNYKQLLSIYNKVLNIN